MRPNSRIASGDGVAIEDEPVGHRDTSIVQSPQQQEHEVDHGSRCHEPRERDQKQCPLFLAARQAHASNQHHEHEANTADCKDVEQSERDEIRDRRQRPLDDRVETGRIPPLDQSRIDWREAGQQSQANRTDTKRPPHPPIIDALLQRGLTPLQFDADAPDVTFVAALLLAVTADAQVQSPIDAGRIAGHVVSAYAELWQERR